MGASANTGCHELTQPGNTTQLQVHIVGPQGRLSKRLDRAPLTVHTSLQHSPSPALAQREAAPHHSGSTAPHTSQGRVSLRSRHPNLSTSHLKLNPTYRCQANSVDTALGKQKVLPQPMKNKVAAAAAQSSVRGVEMAAGWTYQPRSTEEHRKQCTALLDRASPQAEISALKESAAKALN